MAKMVATRGGMLLEPYQMPLCIKVEVYRPTFVSIDSEEFKMRWNRQGDIHYA